MTKQNLLNKFTNQTKTFRVESWDTDVTIKQLSIIQNIQLQAALFKGQSQENMRAGTLQVDMELMQKTNIHAVSLALVEPALSVKEIESMGADFLVGVNEVKAKIDNWDEPKKSEEENFSSN